MKRLTLLAILVAIGLWLALPAVAWGQPSALCNGQTCGDGWYTTPVSVTWNLDGGTNAGGCAPQSYSQDTNQSSLPQNPAVLPAWTYCITNVPGGTDTRFFFIKLELSSPTATASPSRPPDSNGWYNHPVAGAMSAQSFSGIASCKSTTYAGPNATSATVSGSCVDYAGKSVTATSAPFAYDTTPPSLAASAGAGDRSITVSWQAGGDIAPIAFFDVQRSPAPAGAAGATVYSGTSNAYQDTNVQNGVQYTYTITAVDAAGNSSVQSVAATPRPQVLAPTPTSGAAAPAQPPPVVASPPVLSWRRVPHATYYNVQLYRNGHKLLSAWPVKPSCRCNTPGGSTAAATGLSPAATGGTCGQDSASAARLVTAE